MPFEGIPPWIQPADPAAHMATGLQIGARLGAEQAAQQFQAMQMARQEQLQAQEQARFQAEFGLREAEAKRTAEAAARKSAAILAYQQEVTSGGDPLQAILKYGPAMQEPGTAMGAAYRAMIPKATKPTGPPQWVEEDPESGQPGYFMLPNGSIHVPPVPKTEKQGELSAADRESLRADRGVLNSFEKNYGGLEGVAARRMDPEGYKNALSEAQAAAQGILDIQPQDPQARRYVKPADQPAPDTSKTVRILSIRPAGTPSAAPVSVTAPVQPALPGVSGPPPMLGQAATPGALPPTPGAPGTVPPPWLRTLGRLPLFRPITDQFSPPAAVPQETEGGQP